MNIGRIGAVLLALGAGGMLFAQDHGEGPARGPTVGTAPGISAGAANSAEGDVSRGRVLVEGKGACLTCHRIVDRGVRTGVDLSDIGVSRDRAALEKALAAPNPEVLPQNRFYRVVTAEGAVVTGRLMNQDVYSIQMLDSKEKLVSFQTAKLKERGFVATPPMPSFAEKLSKSELTDVIAYLASLKGIVRK